MILERCSESSAHQDMQELEECGLRVNWPGCSEASAQAGPSVDRMALGKPVTQLGTGGLQRRREESACPAAVSELELVAALKDLEELHRCGFQSPGRGRPVAVLRDEAVSSRHSSVLCGVTPQVESL